MQTTEYQMDSKRMSTGVEGLDTVLDGGLIKQRNVLVRGTPGAGKTIFGLYFLSAGVEAGETSLFVNLGEPQAYVEETADDFGLATDGIEFHNLSPTREQFSESESYSLFESAEVEQPAFIASLRETIDDVEPDRVLLDPITEFRYLTSDERQFRKSILGLLDYLKDLDATVMLTSQAGEEITDEDLQFLADGVITLEASDASRAVRVSKFRGSSFRRGRHFYSIDDSGLTVWPTLVPGEQERVVSAGKLSSGIDELDALVGGGIERGTLTILSGPTGVGKTTTGVQFLTESAIHGTKGVLFQFEEAERTIRKRADAIGMPLKEALESGNLTIIELQPDEYTVGEFQGLIREAVQNGTELVMIDGTQGFKQNLRGLEDPTDELLRAGRYLRAAGVSTLLVNEVHNITGEFRATEERTSNLADNILFLRHVEHHGEMRKVIGALKMRTSGFENTLREFEITPDGIAVGGPLPQLRGILTGTPDWKSTEGSYDGP